MALSYPLSLANVFDVLVKIETRFWLDEASSVTETQGGEILQAAYGARLWQGSVTVQADAYANLDQMMARVALLQQAGASFSVTQSGRSGPQADPTGSILGASLPTITAVNANLQDLTISGLPAGYVLTRGDFIGFQYGSSPVRRALHQVITTQTANGSGVISSIQVMPPLRAGYSTPISIDLVRPVCKAVIVPGSFQEPVTNRGIVTTFSFNWRQTLR